MEAFTPGIFFKSARAQFCSLINRNVMTGYYFWVVDVWFPGVTKKACFCSNSMTYFCGGNNEWLCKLWPALHCKHCSALLLHTGKSDWTYISKKTYLQFLHIHRQKKKSFTFQICLKITLVIEQCSQRIFNSWGKMKVEKYLHSELQVQNCAIPYWAEQHPVKEANWLKLFLSLKRKRKHNDQGFGGFPSLLPSPFSSPHQQQHNLLHSSLKSKGSMNAGI